MSASVPPRPDLALDVRSQEPRPKATWRWWEVAVFTIAGFLAGSLVAIPLIMSLDPSEDGPIGGEGLAIAAILDVSILAVLFLWLRAAHPGWPRIIGWPARGSRVREAAVGAGLGILVVLGSVVVTGVVAAILEAMSGETVRPPEQVSSDLRGWALVIFLAFAIGLAPVAEEFVFRGLLFRSVADRHGFWAGALASGVPFGVTHVVPGDALDVTALIVTLTVVGIAFAWIHWRRRNLLSNVVAHSVFNVIGSIVILTGVGA
jgi:membrane protease YdiL (CAAX protease family)